MGCVAFEKKNQFAIVAFFVWFGREIVPFSLSCLLLLLLLLLRLWLCVLRWERQQPARAERYVFLSWL